MSFNADEIIGKCLQSKSSELKLLFREAFELRKKNFLNTIYFYSPGVICFTSSFNDTKSLLKFPAISITGRKCYLNCEHCKGKLLEGMIPAENPSKIV